MEETLFRLGYLSRDRLGAIYAQVYNTEFLDTPPRAIPDETLQLLPAETALELQVVPYQHDDDTLFVLMAGPFEQRTYEDLTADLEKITGKIIRIDFCSSSHLKELLQKYYGLSEKPASEEPTFSSMIESIKTETPDAGLRGEFEELFDVGQTALIGARSHPFNRAVTSGIEEAKQKLNDARKYVESGFEEEAVQMARQAVQLLQEATAKADAVERDWDTLVQQVKSLRAKVNALEEEGCSEYAPNEFAELLEIRESLIECISDRNVERLRYLLDQGTLITERVSLLSPNRNKNREEMIAALAQVRQMIARARKAGAKEYAPDVLSEAYTFLDRAEGSARRARWDEVRAFLSSAEEKAVEAEQRALQAVEETKQLTVQLRDSIRTASAALDEAMALPFAQEAIEDLLRAKDAIADAKTCFDNLQQQRGIALAEETTERLQGHIIPLIKESEEQWNELFQRADECSVKIRAVDIALMMKMYPTKLESLLHAERDMVASLCNRNREELASAALRCEQLLEEVEESYHQVTDQLKNIEHVLSQATDLLTSAAAPGIEADVAPDFVQAGLLLEHARKYVAEGNTRQAAEIADEAISHLREKVIEPQRRVRELWSDLVLDAAGILEEAGEIISLNAFYRCPDKTGLFYDKLTELVGALSSREPESLRVRTDALKEALVAVREQAASAQSDLYEQISAELREIEQSVKQAVEKCSGYYAPDALESVYLDIKRLWEKLSAGPDALDVNAEVDVRRSLAVAGAKLWQVEFLRERFEKEREEDLRQLRLKMDTAREEVEACATLDFVNSSSPLLEQARSLLEQADNLLIEGDIDRSFELVRQCQASLVRLQEDAEEQESRWKELVDQVSADDEPYKALLADDQLAQFAPDEHRNLAELAEETAKIINLKSVKLLSNHNELLNSLAMAVRERAAQVKNEVLERVRQTVRRAQEQIQLARILNAADSCPDVFEAACSFGEIASTFLKKGDYDRVREAAADAYSKASDAIVLAKAAMERAGDLASDYMKIAANHLDQGNAEAAAEALRKGLSLAQAARIVEQDADS